MHGSGKILNKILKILLAAAVTAGLLYWCFHQVHWLVLWEAWTRARWSLLLPAFLVPPAILALNALQWKLFLPRFDRVSFAKMFQLIAVFSMTVNVVPFWGGHALMLYLLGQREKVGKTVALSAITLDQIIEGPAKLLLFGIVFFFAPFPPWMKEGMQGFFLLAVSAYLLLMILAFRFRNQPEESGKLKALIARWAHHLHVLRDWRSLALTGFLAVVTKILEVTAVYFVQASLGLSLGWSSAILVTAAVSLATTFPLTPGRLGVFEAAAMVTYQFLGVSADQALAAAITVHAAHTLPFILLGYLSSIKLGFQRRSYHPAFLTGRDSESLPSNF
jgi:uncharacterized membrane protein YbhN (UPF0104 family)